jgi:hypothetical protein
MWNPELKNNNTNVKTGDCFEVGTMGGGGGTEG